MPHYFNKKQTDYKNSKRLAKCVICDAILDGNSELDICESCKSECERIKKILDYLKINNQDQINIEDISPKTDIAEEIETIKLKKLEQIQQTKPTTGTTVLGTDNGFYTESMTTKKKQAYIILSKNFEKQVIDKDVYIIGKSNIEADFVISDNKTISRKHAQIINKTDEYFIIDMNSTNGTYLNGIKLNPFCEAKIKSGDSFCLSNETFEFVIEE